MSKAKEKPMFNRNYLTAVKELGQEMNKIPLKQIFHDNMSETMKLSKVETGKSDAANLFETALVMFATITVTNKLLPNRSRLVKWLVMSTLNDLVYFGLYPEQTKQKWARQVDYIKSMFSTFQENREYIASVKAETEALRAATEQMRANSDNIRTYMAMSDTELAKAMKGWKV